MRPCTHDDCPEVSVVVPLFNEQENLAALHSRLTAALTALTSYELVFVNDGSGDATPERLDQLQQCDPHVVAVHLSRNFGHQPAVSAGLEIARGRAVIVMDGDLQDPPEVLDQFVAAWRAGNDVVYAVRTRRKEGLIRRAGYALFYRILRGVSDIDIPLDSGDFCLMDRKVVEVLRHLPEKMRFVRGLRAFVGFRQIGLRYERAGRAAGESKYTFRALFRLAIDAIISFSAFPLRLVTYFGLFAAVVAFALMGWVIVDAFSAETAPRGWASTIVVVLFMSAVQLISLGILGEYIRRIFLETKGRPSFIVRDVRRSDALEEASSIRRVA